MVASGMTIGLNLLTTPPLALNRLLIYAARLSGLDSVWALDHWQGPIPTAMWGQTFSSRYYGQALGELLVGELLKETLAIVRAGRGDCLRHSPLTPPLIPSAV
jgi:hypothetical protein